MESKKEHFKRTLLDLANRDDLIPGIYNYCDRWCERCTMTQKCLTYLHEQENKSEEDSLNPDEENKNFWDQIRLAWEVTMEMIEEDADREGIDLNDVDSIELPEHIETSLEVQARNYGINIHKWMKKHKALFSDKAEKLVMIDDDASMFKYRDAAEVIQWYSAFIGAKVHRAHLELDERKNNSDDEYGLYADNLGSAKIAIIAIERSLDALSVFYSGFSEMEDEILQFLQELSQIKKQLLNSFPGVMDFKRPGFDD